MQFHAVAVAGRLRLRELALIDGALQQHQEAICISRVVRRMLSAA